MRPHEMNLHEAVDELENLGSSHDPIFWEDHETTPESLEGALGGSTICTRASKIRISYYGGVDPLVLRKGTLSGMVADRRRMVAREDSVRRSSLEDKMEYCFWSYGPTEGFYMINRELHLFVCSLIDTSDKAHYGAGTWCNYGHFHGGNRVTAVLNTKDEVLAVCS